MFTLTCKFFLGLQCVASGWGLTKGAGNPSNVLLQASLPVVGQGHCDMGNNIR